jgi:hypothetical protein
MTPRQIVETVINCIGPEGEFEPDLERNFQDPAYTTFQESAQVTSLP